MPSCALIRQTARGSPGPLARFGDGELRKGEAKVSCLVGTPKGRLTRLEKKLADQPRQEVRPQRRVKLLPQEDEVYVRAQSGARPDKEKVPTRFNPMVCKFVDRTVRIGEPKKDEINTSRIERLNLSARLFNRRMTRLTLGYSKKLDNLKHSMALFTCFNNWCRVHSSLKKTPAMAQGLTDHVWTIAELLSATI